MTTTRTTRTESVSATPARGGRIRALLATGVCAAVMGVLAPRLWLAGSETPLRHTSRLAVSTPRRAVGGPSLGHGPTPPEHVVVARPSVSDAGADAVAPHLAPVAGHLHVTAEVVLRVARRGSVQARPAKDAATGEVIGLAVFGVAGSPLQDGDVVTEIEGRPLRTQADAVGILGGALAAGAKRVSGRVLRGGRVYTVSAEVPEVGAVPAGDAGRAVP